jgi:hypothetical protein
MNARHRSCEEVSPLLSFQYRLMCRACREPDTLVSVGPVVQNLEHQALQHAGINLPPAFRRGCSILLTGHGVFAIRATQAE